MKAGANDYVMKSNLTRLVPAIEREMREAEVRRQQRRAAELLAASEGRYRQLFERNVAGILRSTIQGKILDCNDAFARMLGHASCKEVEVESTWEFYHSRADRERLLAELHEQRTLLNHEFTLRHKNGECVHVLANLILEEEQGESVIHGTSIDITERKNAERRMMLEQAVARVLADSATMHEAAPRVLQAVGGRLGWDIGAFWTVDSSTNLLRCIEVWHSPHVNVSAFVQASRDHTFSRGLGLPGRIWASGRANWILDVSQDANFPRSQSVSESSSHEKLHGAVGFPIRDGREFYGVMEFFSRELRQPDEAVMKMMDGIGGQLSQFIGRKRLEKRLYEGERDLQLARKIQQVLLPPVPPALPDLEIAGASHPAHVVGGDHFDFLILPDARLGISVADASGHGIAAAILME
jgi:PAS domain S-box-containing protein